MSESSRNKAVKSSSRPGKPGSPAGQKPGIGSSVARSAIAVLLIIGGIAWMAVYINVAQDGAKITWMGDLQRWNFMIGFGLILLGLTVAAHPATPLGRGRGVVVGMLFCFLFGLIWIVVYYVAGQTSAIPLVRSMGQYNLVVGIGFMAVGFVYATHWE